MTFDEVKRLADLLSNGEEDFTIGLESFRYYHESGKLNSDTVAYIAYQRYWNGKRNNVICAEFNNFLKEYDIQPDTGIFKIPLLNKLIRSEDDNLREFAEKEILQALYFMCNYYDLSKYEIKLVRNEI